LVSLGLVLWFYAALRTLFQRGAADVAVAVRVMLASASP
jgi:hypothetical protein